MNRLVRYVGLSLSFDLAMRSMLSTHLRDLFPPSDCNCTNEVLFYAPFWICSNKISKRLRVQDTTVASSDNSLKPFSLNVLLLDMPVLVLSFYRGIQLVCFFIITQRASPNSIDLLFLTKVGPMVHLQQCGGFYTSLSGLSLLLFVSL